MWTNSRRLRRFAIRGVVTLCGVGIAAVALQPPLVAQAQFSRSDFIMILVEGDALQCTVWGQSGKASIYRATANGNTPAFPFVPIRTGVTVERRSARKLASDACAQADYAKEGHVPPGVYGLMYSRLHVGGPPAAPVRHRLGLQDSPCNIPGKCTATLKAPNGVTREAVQFHIAFNDLTNFDKDISEGCITTTAARWAQLFPDPFVDPSTSPLVALNPATAKHMGNGRVLVFVTDVTNDKLQKAQVDLFHNLRTGGVKLSPLVFEDGAALRKLSDGWRVGVP